MKKGYTEQGTNAAGNVIYTMDARPELGEMVFVGNDGYTTEHWGNWVIQQADEGQWNTLDGGEFDSEEEASRLMSELINNSDEWNPDDLRVEQI